jgi:phospholipid/cholesterol/gamma-HCH transport system permease protein
VRAQSVESLGNKAVNLVYHLGAMTLFGAQVLRATFTPKLRIRRLADEVFDVGVLSLAIVCASGAAVGAVLGLQSYLALARFGAEESIGALVGLSMVRELGPVFTALLVTGRAGSAMTAEIASMKTTEQLDGLRMMSVDPIDFVISPKALAMFLVMPLLNALFIGFALFGAYVVGTGLLGIDGGSFLTSLETSVNFDEDIVGSFIKATVFGTMVGLLATYRGYTSEPTSAGVSAATTGTVVIASVSILLVDYIITALWGF